ncbi:MAG: DUF433 domain-containing protein [Cyanobacteria bacterium P01_E01_bin.42]
MEISLQPDLEEFVREQVKKGQYRSPDAVIDIAVRLLASQSFLGIQKTRGVCGGDACIGTTRIPVWSLVNDRRQGMSEAQILTAFPDLNAIDLVNAWAYAEANAEEIETAIRENEEIMMAEID